MSCRISVKSVTQHRSRFVSSAPSLCVSRNLAFPLPKKAATGAVQQAHMLEASGESGALRVALCTRLSSAGNLGSTQLGDAISRGSRARQSRRYKPSALLATSGNSCKPRDGTSDEVGSPAERKFHRRALAAPT